MSPPNVRETEPERRARIQGNLQRLKAAGAPPERIQQYLETERITPEMEAAREPLGVEGTVRGAIANAGEGVGFSLADEAMGGLRGILDPRISMSEGVDQVRDERDRFATAHPKTALGLTLGGAVLPAVLTAGASTAASGTATAAQQAARVAASGAGGGAIAGYGSGEGGALSGSRLGRGAVGAGAGYALGKALPAATGAFRESVAGGQQVTPDLLAALGQSAPSAAQPAASVATRTATAASPTPAPVRMLGPAAPRPEFGEAGQRAALRAFGGVEGVQKGRSLLDVLDAAGMGDEALAMNVGDDLTVRAARAAANQPGSRAGQVVNERLARQGGALGEQVPQDIGRATGFGTQHPEVIADDMQRELSAKVSEGYDAFRALPEVPLDPNDEAQRLFIERYVNPVIQNRRLSGNLSNASALSGENVDAAFKNLQRDVRGAQSAVSMGTKGVNEAHGLESLRDRVLSAISEVDPNYAELGRTYALDDQVGKVVQESVETGRGIKTPGEAIVAKRGATTPGADRALRLGNVAEMQSAARGRGSNADLGDMAQFRDVARSVLGTPQQREAFKALHGEDAYKALLATLEPKMRAAAQNAAARGNSTTAKQLMDALAFQDDAMLDALGGVASGNPAGALRNFVTGKVIGPMDQAYRLGVGRSAEDAAKLLTTRGTPEIRSVLDLLEQLGQSDAAKRTASQPAAGVATRTLTGSTSGGRRP